MSSVAVADRLQMIYITISEKKGRKSSELLCRNISEREKCQIFTCNITRRNISEILCEVGISPKGQKYLIYSLVLNRRSVVLEDMLNFF